MTHLVSIWIGPGQCLVPPIDGVDVAVNAVVVGGVRTGRSNVVKRVRFRLGEGLQPGEQDLGATVGRHFGHLGELAGVETLGAAGVVLETLSFVKILQHLAFRVCQMIF